LGSIASSDSGPGARVATNDLLIQEPHMTDLLMLALGLFFFALTLGYAYACTRL